MGGLSFQNEIQIHLGGRLIDDVAHLLAAVQDVAEIGLQIGLQMLGAEEPHLLLNGEHDLDTAVGDFLVLQLGQDGQNDRNPGLVVRSENGLTVAVDHAVADDRHHSLRGADGIHVGAEQDGGSGGVPRHADNDVARIAAGQRGRTIDRRRPRPVP